jgi:hypothetical protein
LRESAHHTEDKMRRGIEVKDTDAQGMPVEIVAS